jgi:transposase
MTKSIRARYTLEFKEEAVCLVTDGERVATVARNLGLSEQTLHNWVNAAGNGGLKSSAKPTVNAEQMEISRLRKELSRVKMERDILRNHRGPQFRLWATCCTDVLDDVGGDLFRCSGSRLHAA